MFGITKAEVLENDLRYNLRPWAAQKNQRPLAIEKAEGVYLWDFDGNRYFDMSSQLVNVNAGHKNVEIIDGIKRQLDDFAYLAPAYAVSSRSRLAEKVVALANKHAGGAFAKVFFTCGGAESNDNAVLIARAVTGRAKIISAYRSYHGSTIGAGNLSGDARRFAAEKPAATGFIKFPGPYIYRERLPFASEEEIAAHYIENLRDIILFEGPQNIAAITMEPVAGTSGVIIPPRGYLVGLRKLCDEYGILLHFDEVMSGFGRTGRAFAFENFGAVPDIITFAKGITSGYVPLGGVIVSQKIAAFYDDKALQCGLTYNGHPLACAAGIATLDFYEKHGVFENSAKLGLFLSEELASLKAKHSSAGDVRSLGLFAAVELVKDKKTKESIVSGDLLGGLAEVIALLYEKGFATIGRNNNVIVAPPLTITESELREALGILDEVLAIVDKRYKQG
jgi:taurine--2-oxoglutarate transaminase